MWTFDNLPADRMRADIGWAPDQAWLDHVMHAAGRIPGCSAAVVSPNGLALTNYHCVDDCVHALSNGEQDYQANGVAAHAREEELRCPSISLLVLQQITNVTPQIDAAAGVSPTGFAAARDAAIALLERNCVGDDPTIRCEVVTLYQGGRYALYRYKRYGDVRVVFTPEEAAAFFGFPPDNFNFPRYAADFAFLRVYENGAPASTPNFLQMDADPVVDNQVTLVAGHPGRTSRLSATAELAFQRDYLLPMRVADLTDWRDALLAFGARGPSEAHQVSEALHSAENALKVYWGRRVALENAAVFARIAEGEADLQARVARNRAAQREIGDPWGEIAAAETRNRENYQRLEYLETRAGNSALLFRWARDLVRAADERAKPNAERLPEYGETRLRAVELRIEADVALEPSLEQMRLAFWLGKLRDKVAPSDPSVAGLFANETPEALAERLVATTRLGDLSERVRLWRGGAAAIAASDDPLIVLARAIDASARTARAFDTGEVDGPIERASERIARVRFRAFGDSVYPEATFSLRLSYGRIKGWTEINGHDVPAFTTFAGLRERATGAPPHQLSPRWADALNTLDPATALNIVSDHDIIGGNSGSPLLDTEGRVLGVVFDGNLYALGGEYLYNADFDRAVAVSSAAIRAALLEIYGMTELAAELGWTPPPAPTPTEAPAETPPP